MLHGFNFSKLVLILPIILTFFNTRDLYSKCARTPNQPDSDVTCSRLCDQGKITKRIERQSGLRKTRFF